MKLPITYYFGYPLVTLGFFGELIGLYHHNPLMGVGIMLISTIFIFVGAMCFFHALLKMGRRNDPESATTGRET